MDCDRKLSDGDQGSWLTHGNGVRAGRPLSTDGGGVRSYVFVARGKKTLPAQAKLCCTDGLYCRMGGTSFFCVADFCVAGVVEAIASVVRSAADPQFFGRSSGFLAD